MPVLQSGFRRRHEKLCMSNQRIGFFLAIILSEGDKINIFGVQKEPVRAIPIFLPSKFIIVSFLHQVYIFFKTYSASCCAQLKPVYFPGRPGQ